MCLLLNRSAKVVNEVGLLRCACNHTEVNLLKCLVARGMDIHHLHLLPLHLGLLARTVEDDCDISSANIQTLLLHTPGLTPPYLASFTPYKQLELINILLQVGADPNQPDPVFKLTPGHLVSRGHKVELYKLLLAHGWDMHTTDARVDSSALRSDGK